MIVYQEALVEVRQGHVLEALEELGAATCQLCVTSPPYFNLRCYAVEPQIFGGLEGCGHVWGGMGACHHPGQVEQTKWKTADAAGHGQTVGSGQFCQACGAWKGSLGNEPTPWCDASMRGEACADACYLGHLLSVCDGIWRVLRNDGLLVWNMSDSFAGSWGNQGRKPTRGTQRPIHGPMMQPLDDERYPRDGHDTGKLPPGLKPKNLLNLPARFSIAMQARGWILRSAPNWLKRNSMPESVTDRPSVSHETVYLFSKQSSYYWDPDAIREPHQMTPQRRPVGRPIDETPRPNGQPKQSWPTAMREVLGVDGHPNGRNRRTADWWFESLDALIADTEAWLAHAKQVRAHGGLLLSPEGEPLGLNVNPEPTKMKHFASFATRLVEPFIQAGTSAYGCCRQCQKPWARVVIREPGFQARREMDVGAQQYRRRMGSAINADYRGIGCTRGQSLAWMPQCACGGYEIIPTPFGPMPSHAEYWQARQAQIEALWPAVEPCVVLDPFAGKGTTGAVSRSLGRRSVSIDLSAEYCEMMKQTLHADLPLFPGANEDEDRAYRVIQSLLDFDDDEEATRDELG